MLRTHLPALCRCCCLACHRDNYVNVAVDKETGAVKTDAKDALMSNVTHSLPEDGAVPSDTAGEDPTGAGGGSGKLASTYSPVHGLPQIGKTLLYDIRRCRAQHAYICEVMDDSPKCT